MVCRHFDLCPPVRGWEEGELRGQGNVHAVASLALMEVARLSALLRQAPTHGKGGISKSPRSLDL